MLDERGANLRFKKSVVPSGQSGPTQTAYAEQNERKGCFGVSLKHIH